MKSISSNCLFLYWRLQLVQRWPNRMNMFSKKESVIFPDVFEHLTWRHDEQLMRKKFPNSTVENVEYGESMITTIFSGIELPYFGQASIDVVHDHKGRVQSYKIGTDESRLLQCSPERENRPKSCRNMYGQHLVKIKTDLHEYIQKKFGRGVVTNLCDLDYATIPKKNICVENYSWRLEGNEEMSLGIYKGEDGWWEAQFMITRNAR